MWNFQTRTTRIKRRKPFVFPTEYWHTNSFEILKCSRQIKKCFCSSRNSDNGIIGDRIEVCRDITSEFCTSMHTTNTASRKNADSPGCRNGNRSRHGRRTEIPLLRNSYGDITFGDLSSRSKNSFMFGISETKTHDTMKNRRHCRNTAAFANSRAATIKRFAVCRRRQPEMRVDR
ncbi:unannotated protein [freshwater metagenome]|uniref:Unannotated protein n=1 Tax=freshwater metagenome TaxID=449393 RepID=A0A6J6X1V4_9ZZZZ